jgi:hypothetical protein
LLMTLFLCRATSAFPSSKTARVAQAAAGATHVFARVRQIFMSHTLYPVKNVVRRNDWLRLSSGPLS